MHNKNQAFVHSLSIIGLILRNVQKHTSNWLKPTNNYQYYVLQTSPSVQTSARLKLRPIMLLLNQARAWFLKN